MHVSTFDTNTLEWTIEELPGEAPFGPETALAFLCTMNGGDDEVVAEMGDPVGPIRFWGEQNAFCLLSAWCGGRQWFMMLTIFSDSPLADEALIAFLAEAGIEDGEEE